MRKDANPEGELVEEDKDLSKNNGTVKNLKSWSRIYKLGLKNVKKIHPIDFPANFNFLVYA